MVTTHTLNNVYDQINKRLCKVLTYAQMAMTEHQFKAFRASTLDEFGNNGLRKDLESLLDEGNHPISDRNGRE